MSYRGRCALLATTLLLAVAGCSDDDGSAPPKGSLVGTYQLQTVDGDPLPVTTTALLAEPVRINSGTVQLNTNGTFAGEFKVTQTVGGIQVPGTVRQSGVYVAHDNTIVFTDPSDSTSIEAVRAGSGFTLSYQGIVLVYTRR